MDASSSLYHPASGPPVSLKTHPSRARISKELTSTPSSQSSSTNSVPHCAKQSDFASFQVRYDVQHEKRVSPVEFCRLILNLELQNSDEVDDFETLRNVYCREVGHEQDRYEPFCDYVNAILGRGKSKYTVCRNDPTILWGTNSHRKPDTTTLHQDSLRSVERSTIDLAQNGPAGAPFHPAELYSFFEFKLIKAKLTPNRPQGSGQSESKAKRSKSKSESKSKSKLRQTPSDSRAQGVSSGSKRKEHPTNSTGERQSKRIANQVKPFVPVLKKRPAPAPFKAEEPTDAEIDPVIQCASYAVEMMSCVLREHVIAFLVEDDTIELLYYDRSILIRSEPLNFIQDWAMFESLIARLGKMSAEDWGFRPTLIKVNGKDMTPESLFGRGLKKPKSSAGDSPVENFFEGAILEVGGDWELELKNIVHQTHGLRGRGTIAIAAERVQGRGVPREKYFVKISWQPISRRSESEFLRHIYDKVAENEDDYKWVLKHLPELKAETSHGDLVGIQARLKAHNDFKNVYEERILRIHVFDMLHKLSEFRSGPVFFIRRFAQIVKCHRWVHDVAGIMHRDVSLNNMMYREKNGTIYGVLNDFDLASLVADLKKGPQSLQRTGTRIYMAFDLLSSPSPPPHLNRYDLESFYYVLIDITRKPEGDNYFNMDTWYGLDDANLVTVKMAACSITPMHRIVLASFATFASCLMELRAMFNHCALFVSSDPTTSAVDVETLGGVVTKDLFISHLEAFLHDRPDD